MANITPPFQVQATDLDSEPNAQISYYIVLGDNNHQFMIHPKDGFISVKDPLDRETVSSAAFVENKE